MENKYIAISLFNGMGCAFEALKVADVTVSMKISSEIDKYATIVNQANHPDTIQIGDVKNIIYDKSTKTLSNGTTKIKLPNHEIILLGGSPCQSFSFAGKRKGMATKCETEITTLEQYLQLKNDGFEFEGQSYLFWEYMRILKEVKPKYFLLENVMMGEKWERVLSRAIGVNPIEINSALVSAQNRRRLYWTNIGLVPGGLFGFHESIIKQPKDKGILLKDILESEVDTKYFLSEKSIQGLMKHKAEQKEKGYGFGAVIKNGYEKMNALKIGGSGVDDLVIDNTCIKIDKKGNIKNNQDKASCFTAGGHSGGNHSDMDLIVHNTMPRSSKTGKGGTGPLSRNDGKTYCLDTGQTNAVEIRYVKQINPSTESGGRQPYQQNMVYDIDGISPALMAQMSCGTYAIFEQGIKIRRLTPTECERLQTVPDGYTSIVSDTQRYRMLGNGWTVDVIAHILSYVK